MSNLPVISGSGGGGGKGGGGGGGFSNKPDTLRSTDSFECLLGLGSGRWKGLTNGLKSLYINKIPLENDDGSTNFEGITALFADGDPTQKQLVSFKLGGGGGITTVNTTIGNLNAPGTPGPWISGATLSAGAHYVDLRFLVNQLAHQKTDGIFEATATLEINMRPQGTSTWVNPLLVPAVPSNYDPNTGSYVVDGTGGGGGGGSGSDGGLLLSDTSLYTVYMPTGNTELIAQAQRPDDGGISGEMPLLSGLIDRRYVTQDGITDGYFVIRGKTTSTSVKELRIAVPNVGAFTNKIWEVRVRLIEKAQEYIQPNTEDQEEINRNLTFESITAVTKEVFGSAEEWRGLAWIQVGGKASEQMNGFPELRGIFDTKIVKVPPATVFNPNTRQYTGTLWDGSYSLSYTNDPAWCLKELIEDEISGVAALSPGANLDKWDALEASKYCSELVPDGQGGTHPRFSMNLRIENQLPVQEVIQYMAGAFNGLCVDTGDGKWRLKIDKPETPVATFTVDNIFGEFQYSHTDIDTRYNDLTLSFINKETDYQEDRVRIFDQAHIDKYGRKPTSIVAVGADNRQEALRRGVLRLRTNMNENKIVKFTTNRQGRYLEPLQTILVADQHLGYMPPTGSANLADTDPFDNRTTSRITSMNAGRTEITLGRTVRLEPTVTYKVKITVPNSNYNPSPSSQPTNADWKLPTIVIERTLTNSTAQRGDVSVLYLNSALPANTPVNAHIALDAPGMPTLPYQYRILEINPSEGEEVAISAILVDTGKYAAADAVTETNVQAWQQTGAVGVIPTPTPPTYGMFTLTSYQNNGQTQRTFTVNWNRPSSLFINGYKVESRLNGGSWQTHTELTNQEYYEITDPTPGTWEFRITANDRRGGWSSALIGSYLVPAVGAVDTIVSAGTLANRPSTNLTINQQYIATDQTPIKTYLWDGSAWIVVATAGGTLGSNLYSNAGVLLTDAQVITIQGTAAAITGQAVTATNPDFAGITGATRPANGATADVTFIPLAGAVVTGNKVSGNGTVTGWATGATSVERYVGSAVVSARPLSPPYSNTHQMFGLIDTVLTNAGSNFFQIDYGFYLENAGYLKYYESGDYNDLGTWSSEDRFTISYDGINVRWYQNGTLLRTSATTANRVFYSAVSLWQTGAATLEGFKEIQFGPFAQAPNLSTNIYDPAGGTFTPIPRTEVRTSLGTAAAITGQAPTATSSDFSVITGATRPENYATAGDNWLVNGSFANGTTAWTMDPNTVRTAGVAGDPAPFYIRATNTTGGGFSFYTAARDVPAGQRKLFVSIWTRGHHNGRGTILGMNCYDAVGTYLPGGLYTQYYNSGYVDGVFTNGVANNVWYNRLETADLPVGTAKVQFFVSPSLNTNQYLDYAAIRISTTQVGADQTEANPRVISSDYNATASDNLVMNSSMVRLNPVGFPENYIIEGSTTPWSVQSYAATGDPIRWLRCTGYGLTTFMNNVNASTYIPWVGGSRRLYISGRVRSNGGSSSFVTITILAYRQNGYVGAFTGYLTTGGVANAWVNAKASTYIELPEGLDTVDYRIAAYNQHTSVDVTDVRIAPTEWGATLGATTGTDIRNSTGALLTQNQLVTLEGTAASIVNQAATATSADFSVITGTTKPEANATYTKNQSGWVAGTLYKVGDFVQYANASYICVTQHTANASFPPGHASNTQFDILAARGITTQTIYIRSNATPATPTGNNPAGWALSLPATPTDNAGWSSTGQKKGSDVLIGIWSTPVRVTGQINRGAYAINTLYYTDNLVTYLGGTYYPLQTNFQNQAPSGTDQANTYWGVQQAPPLPPASGSQTLTLSMIGGTAGVTENIRTLANSAGYTGGDLTLTVNVTGTYSGAVGSNSAIRSGTFPLDKTIAITINVNSGGNVHGGGGYGGAGATFGGNPGSMGGPGFLIEHNITGGITVNSGGAIRGGGGGGGGGGGRAITQGPIGEEETTYYIGGQGGNGGTNAAGQTGGVGETTGCGQGGTGGDGSTNPPTAGSAGASGFQGNGGAGGAAGKSVEKSGKTCNVVNNGGTIAGTAS